MQAVSDKVVPLDLEVSEVMFRRPSQPRVKYRFKRTDLYGLWPGSQIRYEVQHTAVLQLFRICVKGLLQVTGMSYFGNYKWCSFKLQMYQSL